MSERPFMQLYVSDFVGDTLHLSTEQVGAYLLLLMAMWNAGGSLPNEEVKLARIARLSVKKWRAVATDLMGFFEVDGDAVRHSRLTKELQKSKGKSQSRASAGAKGGAAKALKDKGMTLANASVLPRHLPDTRNHIEAASQHRAPVDLIDRLLEAACIRGNPSPSLAFPGPIIALIQAGYDLEAEILPAMRAKPKPDLRSWNWYVPIIREVADGNRRIASETKPDPLAALRSWPDSKWQVVLEHSRQRQEWSSTYGPAPGQPGCLVPPHLLDDGDQAMTRVAA